MTPMPEWEQIVAEHAPVVWQTVCRLLPEELAARVFTGTFMASRNEARRDSVADWSVMLRRLASARAVSAARDLPDVVDGDLTQRLQGALRSLSDQQATLYCLRYLWGLNFNEIAMELAIPLDAIGKVANDACAKLGKRLLAEMPGLADDPTAPERRAADDILEQATIALRDRAVPEMPPGLVSSTVSQLIEAGPIETYEKPIQRSPLPAVITICVLAVLVTIAVALYITKRPKPPAFAFDVVVAAMEPMNSASFQMVKTVPYPDGGVRKVVANVVMADAWHLRQTMDGGNPVILWDLEQKKTLTLDATKSRATLRALEDTFREYRPVDPIGLVKSLPPAEARFAEQTTLFGRPAQGFTIPQASGRVNIWADTQTRLPLLVEVFVGEQATLLLSDFEWNPAVDAAMVSLDTPPGYQLEATKLDVMATDEQDVVAALRVAATFNGGRFPDEFSRAGMAKLLADVRGKLPADSASEEYREAKEQFDRDVLQLGRGWLYIAEHGDDWHYAGGGTYLGSDRPVMWYRPSGSRLYHVIDGALSIRPVNPDRLPDVPSTQMVAPSTQPRGILR